MTTWNDDEMVAEMVGFVKWWLSPEIQTEFARRGGQSGRQSVYNQPDYVTFRPWNRTWASSLDWQKDVWHVPLLRAPGAIAGSTTRRSPASSRPRDLDNIRLPAEPEEEGLIE
jgi:ABC-type glycerol-3-phosphate transport system substrate-binding protein